MRKSITTSTTARLSHYVNGAVGTAALLSTTSTQAAVIYWDPTDMVATPTGEGFTFDMVSGVVASAATPVSVIPTGFVIWNYAAPNYVQLARSTNLLDPVVGGDYMSNLSATTAIGSASSFGGYGLTYFDSNNAGGFPWNTEADGTTGFLGLRFAISGNTHYGWARFTYDDATTGNITLHDFAYENVAGTNILAGAGSVPEVSTGLLALAGLAGATLRRRRN